MNNFAENYILISPQEYKQFLSWKENSTSFSSLPGENPLLKSAKIEREKLSQNIDNSFEDAYDSVIKHSDQLNKYLSKVQQLQPIKAVKSPPVSSPRNEETNKIIEYINKLKQSPQKFKTGTLKSKFPKPVYKVNLPVNRKSLLPDSSHIQRLHEINSPKLKRKKLSPNIKTDVKYNRYPRSALHKLNKKNLSEDRDFITIQ